MAGANTNLPYPVAVSDDDTENPQTTFAGSTSALTLPAGTTGQRPASPIQGQIRFNVDTGQLELYSGGSWGNVKGISTDRTYITASNTNLTPTDSGIVANNKGAGVKTNFNAPTAAATSFQVKLENMTTFGARFTVPAGSLIYFAGSVSTDGGYIEFTDPGTVILLERSNSTDWVAQASTSGGVTLA